MSTMRQLMPLCGGAADGGQITAALLLGAVRDERRADEVDADAVHHLRSAGAGHLFLEDRLLSQRRTAPAVRLRPVHGGPAGFVQPPLPRGQKGGLGLERGRRRLPRHMVGEPRAQRGAEGFLGGSVGEVHGILGANKYRRTVQCVVLSAQC
jgi:hypothetical protein